MRKKLLANTVPGNGVVATVAKDSKLVKIRATVYPSGGSQPYEEDVQVKDDGTFTLHDKSMSYHVSRGSVILGLDGLMRTIVNEAEAQTVNIYSLKGENVMHPMTLNAIAENNYWQQWGDFLRSQGLGRKLATWGMMAAAVVLILVTIWQVVTLGDGFEDLARTFSNAYPAAPTPQEAGHNVIAPGA